MPLRKKRTSDDKVVLQNAIKTLAANIRFSSVDNPIRTIAVVSSIPSEGKTTISANLGAAIVSNGTSVVLVECDMRRRSMASELGVHGRHGLYSVLSGHHTLGESVVPTKTEGLYFLDAEPGIPNPPDLLQSKRFHQLIDQLTRSYDYVIFDTPPVSTFVDAAVISSMVDATLLVVRQDYTRREEVTESIGQLKQAGANLIGTVLNYCDAEVSSKYYGYYKERKSSSDALSSREDVGAPEAVPEESPHSALKPIPEGAPIAASVPEVDGEQSAPAAVHVPMVPDASSQSAVASMGTGDSHTATGTSAPRRIVPRKRSSSSFSGSPDETMAFLAQAGYTPRHSEGDSNSEN